MAHTTRKVNLGNAALAEVIFTSYTEGGEQFTLTEFGLTGSMVGLWFLDLSDNGVAGATNSQNAGVAQYLGSGLIKLVQDGQEIPTQTLTPNWVFFIFVQGT